MQRPRSTRRSRRGGSRPWWKWGAETRRSGACIREGGGSRATVRDARGGGRVSAQARAPWWLPGGHLQTLYGALFYGSRVDWKRERWDTPDGDFIDVDRLAGPNDAPLVVLFHGLEGGSGSHYAGALARELARNEWRCALPHFRGWSGGPNRPTPALHFRGGGGKGWGFLRFFSRGSGAPPFSVGVSLGGNALLKWLGG